MPWPDAFRTDLKACAPMARAARIRELEICDFFDTVAVRACPARALALLNPH